MSDAQQGGNTTIVVQSVQNNGLGLAGFILSLFGFMTCGLLSPFGLLFSTIGLFKTPRGLAVAGFILSLIGTVWVVLGGGAILIGLMGLGAAVETAREQMGSVLRVNEASILVIDFRLENDRLPTAAEANELFGQIEHEDNRLVYEPKEDGVFVIADIGRDGQRGTPDDYELESQSSAKREIESREQENADPDSPATPAPEL